MTLKEVEATVVDEKELERRDRRIRQKRIIHLIFASVVLICATALEIYSDGGGFAWFLLFLVLVSD